jgi:hypothetical protein
LAIAEKIEGKLVSRSQAKRIAAGLEAFSEVEFDFSSVRRIEQGFADELFRVWRAAHPSVRVHVSHPASEVADMLRHVGFRDPGSG